MLEGVKKRATALKKDIDEGLEDAQRRMSKEAEHLRVEGLGLWTAVSKNPSGAMNQVLKGKPRVNRHLVYNPQQMCSWAIFRAYHGTVIADEKIYKVSRNLLIVAMSSILLVFICCPRPQDLKMSPFFQLVLYFKVFIAFMLGMYMSFCLKRWWMCMQTLTDFFLGIRKISFFLNAAGVPLDKLTAMQRLSMLSSYLLENEVTSIFTTDTAEREEKWQNLVIVLKEEGLVSAEELMTLEQHVEHDGRALVVWTWVACHVTKLEIPAPLRGVLYELVTKQTDLVTQIKTFLIFQLPYMYSHMLACFVHMNNVLIAVACGVGIAVSIGDMVQGWSWWSKDRQGVHVPDSIHPRTQVYVGIQMIFVHMLVLFVQPLIYQAFLEIASMLCDPFTHQIYGVPIHDLIFETKRLIRDQTVFNGHDLDEMEKNYRKQHLKSVMRSAGTPVAKKE